MRGLSEYKALLKFIESLQSPTNPYITLDPYDKCAFIRGFMRVRVRHVVCIEDEWWDMFKARWMEIRFRCQEHTNTLLYIVFQTFCDLERIEILEHLLDCKVGNNFILDSIASHTFYGILPI